MACGWTTNCTLGGARRRGATVTWRGTRPCVHLESGSDVVILYGEVRELGGEDRTLAQRMTGAANEKYGYGTKAEDYLVGGTFAFTPRKVIAWKTLYQDATRWEF
jgi:hypothetical protein